MSESEKYEVILDTIANFNDLKDSQTGEVITEDDGRVWNMIILKNGIQCIVSYKPGSTNGISCNWEEWNAKKKSAQ